MHISIYTDGGARGNPGPAAAAYLIKFESGEVIQEGGVYLGNTTNNHAEYEAVKQALIALETLIAKNQEKIDQVRFFLDSKLVVEQLSGRFKVKNQNLIDQVASIRDLLNKLAISTTFSYIPRAQNFEADALVNQVLDSSIQ